MIIRKMFGTVLFAAVLLGCGGGENSSYGTRSVYDSNQHSGSKPESGNNVVKPPVVPPEKDKENIEIDQESEGFFKGTTDNGLDLELFVLSDGTYWGAYSLLNNPSVLAGFFHGNSMVKANQLISTDLKNFSIFGRSLYSGELSALITSQKTINGVINYSPSSQVTLKTEYIEKTFSPINLDEIEGAYVGQLGTLESTESIGIMIEKGIPYNASTQKNRRIYGVLESGCKFEGGLTQSENTRHFNLTIDFLGNHCILLEKRFYGVMLFDSEKNSIKLMGISQEGNHGLLSQVVKTSTNESVE